MNTAISRYEFKYLLTDEQASAVRDHTRLWMEPDPMGGPNGCYPITSLYLDRADWLLARQTWEGVRERFKLRIRYYGERPETVFAEVKKRIGTTIAKLRVQVPPSTASALSHNGEVDLPDAFEFRELCQRIQAEPGLWVRYDREAWVSPWGDGARLTFDMGLEVQEPTGYEFLPTEGQWRVVPLERPVILEMKFTGAHPLWMQRIAEGLQLERTSCSKYAQGVDAVLDGPWSTRWGSDPRRNTWRRG